MRVLLINSVCGIKSTGRICTDIAEDLSSQGHEVKIAYGRDSVPEEYEHYAVKIGKRLDVYYHALSSRLLDNCGFASTEATKEFLLWAEEFNPDMLWLHNLHGYYIDVRELFLWIKSRPGMQVKWTLHDCWAFTGHCVYFDRIKCDKWKTGCFDCPNKSDYPVRFFADNSKRNYEIKKSFFSNVQNMQLITPSMWLANLVSHSFLSSYPIEVINNTIDTDVFKPTPGNFREKQGVTDKFVVLGVSNAWESRKGLDDFIKLRQLLDDNFAVVLVGLRRNKPIDGIITIPHTDSKKELAAIYSASDVFLNLTYEDNYPTTNLEAQACGTKCITYRTGGSPESVPPENVVDQGNLYGIVEILKEERKKKYGEKKTAEH